jgi:hypothetical protein
MMGKRRRVEGSRSNSPRNRRKNTARKTDSGRFEADFERDYPETYAKYLACPFKKHDSMHHCGRYRWVKSCCTEGWGFPTIGKLT